MNDFDNFWDYIAANSRPKRIRKIDLARMVCLIDIPIKARNSVRLSKNVRYTPLSFRPRDPQSTKRKINRWIKKLGDPAKSASSESLKEIKTILDKKISQLFVDDKGIHLLEIPTAREGWVPLFLMIGNKTFSVILIRDAIVREKFKNQRGFWWKNYFCVVFSLSRSKCLTTLGQWARNAMIQAYDVDLELFEFVLLNDLPIFEIALDKQWRSRHKNYYHGTLISFLNALTGFFNKNSKS